MSPARRVRKHAILFKFRGHNPRKAALKKKGDQGGAVVYYALQNPMYFIYRERAGKWHHQLDRPTYRYNDEVIFVFRDTSLVQSEITAIGAAIDFQQAISPFDDEWAADMRMTAATPYSFVVKGQKEPWPTFALGHKLPESPEAPTGYPLESRGRFQYTVSLVTFAGTDPIVPAHRYWIDPEMDIGN